MLRPLIQADLPQVLDIENAVHITPWPLSTFQACLTQGIIGWVIEVEGRIIGFVLISLFFQECHVLNLAVLHDYQHQGYGRKLMEKVLATTQQQNVTIIYLEVRRSNQRAIKLYTTLGFEQVGERKDYYESDQEKEDALIFIKSF